MAVFLRHPELEIDVAPDEFVFRQDGNVVRLRTIVQPDVGAGVRGFGMEGYPRPRHPLALFAPGGERLTRGRSTCARGCARA